MMAQQGDRDGRDDRVTTQWQGDRDDKVTRVTGMTGMTG